MSVNSWTRSPPNHRPMDIPDRRRCGLHDAGRAPGDRRDHRRCSAAFHGGPAAGRCAPSTPCCAGPTAAPRLSRRAIATGYIVTAQGGRLLIGRDFTDADKEELLRDNRRLARLLHVPMRGYPETLAEMNDYFEAMIDTLQGTS